MVYFFDGRQMDNNSTKEKEKDLYTSFLIIAASISLCKSSVS